MSAYPAAQDAESLAQEILCNLDTAVLRRRAPKRYELRGRIPSFYSRLFPGLEDGEPCQSPWKSSLMLEFFLRESEDFFESQPGPGTGISSGIWLEASEEAGRDVPLLAWARQMERDQVILIQRVIELYDEKTRLLRKARSELLERRKIASDFFAFQEKARYDPLTQIYNRGAFMEILQKQIRGSYSPILSLIMLDIDNFKTVNDTYGHLAGDSVLVQLGAILKTSLRQNDAAFRYGGEEFAVLTPHAALDQALSVAEKLRRQVEGHNFALGPGAGSITISLGCTSYRNGESPHDFIDRADYALYQAKRQGKNQVQVRDPWLD